MEGVVPYAGPRCRGHARRSCRSRLRPGTGFAVLRPSARGRGRWRCSERHRRAVRGGSSRPWTLPPRPGDPAGPRGPSLPPRSARGASAGAAVVPCSPSPAAATRLGHGGPRVAGAGRREQRHRRPPAPPCGAVRCALAGRMFCSPPRSTGSAGGPRASGFRTNTCNSPTPCRASACRTRPANR